MRTPSRSLIALALLVPVLAGCGGSPDPAAAPQTPAAAASVSPVASTTTAPAGSCTVPGFVPTLTVHPVKRVPAISVQQVHSVAASGSTRLVGSAGTLPGLAVSAWRTPEHGALDASTRLRILTRFDAPIRKGGVWTTGWRMTLRAPHGNRTFVIYHPLTRVTGTFRATVCGAPYNDGTKRMKVGGRFSTYTRPGHVTTYACTDPVRGTRAELAKNAAGCF